VTAISFCIAADQTDRLDRFLADQLALSRTQAARLIADKRVTARGKPLRASALLERGTEVTVDMPDEAPPRTYAPAHADLRFIYED
jgi:23S rRNA-/tRNA-specific pseudouridylate synthase